MKSHLNKLLNKNNISLNKLHKMTGISRTTLDPLLKNDTIPNKTRIGTLQKICRVLNISFSELAEEELVYDVVNFQTVSKYGNFEDYKTDDMSNLFAKSTNSELGIIIFEYILLIRISSPTSTVFIPCNLIWSIGEDRCITFDINVDRSRIEITDDNRLLFFDRFDIFTENFSVLLFAKA
ncbi:helix-turn-helix transcriptional regulator, partial [Enterococcus mundtii]|uniref:helix-turn-helix domain-containing protein n=1 Tax=Enterococcus mundtii TaxID=53346 RepID=UPI00325B29DB